MEIHMHRATKSQFYYKYYRYRYIAVNHTLYFSIHIKAYLHKGSFFSCYTLCSMLAYRLFFFSSQFLLLLFGKRSRHQRCSLTTSNNSLPVPAISKTYSSIPLSAQAIRSNLPYNQISNVTILFLIPWLPEFGGDISWILHSSHLSFY